MYTIRVKDIVNNKILVTRESAHLLEGALRDAQRKAAEDQDSGTVSICVDFRGAEGMAPSFLDELLVIFDALVSSESSACRIRSGDCQPSEWLVTKVRGHRPSTRDVTFATPGRIVVAA
ncbi:MAG: hypothetical protein D6788_05435 [Planctomycetota bacterium]|nr:MAG: hypothetical protein D6788_05435 [Planctomycetota bacterium]